MKRSTDRILTTFVGSLARPSGLLDLMTTRERGQPYDQAAYDSAVNDAVADVVRQQVEAGVDIVCDGEQGKPGFFTYVAERLSGFESVTDQPDSGPWAGSRETLAFPEFYAWFARGPGGSGIRRIAAPFALVCKGPITYRGHEAVQRDIATLKAAVDQLEGVSPEEVFMPASSPTNIEGPRRNEYYATQEEYVYAIADAMREEYQAIVDAGFLLQVDDPRLLTYYVVNPGLSVEDCRRWADIRVDALNHALRDIPVDRIRFHTCYGINIGPRIHEIDLKDIVDILLRIKASAYSFEGANPRHEHEWQVWEDVDLPDDKVLIPGVITHSTNLVEHPELIAQRLLRYANIVGRERVIGGSDCGFSSQATAEPEVHPSVVWLKFQAMAEGARLASQRLW